MESSNIKSCYLNGEYYKKDFNKSYFFIFCFFALTLFPYILNAQKPLLKNYTNIDGLPSNEVYMVLQDKNGYIWMATNYGVCRFDGYNFESFTTKDGLTDNTVYELFEDYKGRIWFVTSNLKFSYFENNKIFPYRYNEKINKLMDWVIHIENRSFYVDSLDNLFFSVVEKGAFIVSRNGIISKFNSNKIKNKTINLLKVAANKYILSRILTYSDSIYYELNNKLKSINNNNGKFNRINYAVSICYFSSDKKLYFSEDKDLYVLSDSCAKIYKMPDFIISVDEDCWGNIWIGLRDDGAICYKDDNYNMPPYLHVLKGIPVSKIFSDSEGGIWFSTTTNGVFYTPSLSILSYTTSDGLISNQVNSVIKTKNDEIAVFYRDFKYNVIKKNHIFKKEENIPKNEAIEFVKNKFYRKWISTNRMLYINENSVTKKIYDKYNIYNTYFLKIFNVKSVLEIDSELTYVSSLSYLYKIRRNNVSLYKAPYINLGITNLCIDKNGVIYFGSKVGPGIFDGDSLIMLFKKYPELKINVYSMLYDDIDKSLWIATKGDGIFILKNNKIKNISIKAGLSSNYVKHLYLENNKVWASTNEGINVIYLNKSEDTSYKINVINSTMGLISNVVNGICVSGNYVYAATDNGLSFFNPSEINIGLKNKPVKITGVQVNERDTLLYKIYKLPYNYNNILISYKYLSYSNAGKHNYMYRLIGLSDQWKITKSTDIRFTTLPPGKYIFEIKFVSPENIPSCLTESIEFIINKPYWETWWFILILVSFVLFLILSVYRYQINVISKQNKLKLQLLEYQWKALSSQINPHFIFNSLNSIQLYILNNDIVKSNKYLTKFSKLMRSVLDNSQESSITLENEINTLTNYIEIESHRFHKKFEYEIKTDLGTDLKKVRIPTFLIQPFVENAIWHGLMNKEEKGFLSVTLVEEETTIKCIVQDNGVGRMKSSEINSQKSSIHKSLGAQITQERLNLLNTQYKNNLKIITTDLYDLYGNPIGTKVELTIPKITK